MVSSPARDREVPWVHLRVFRIFAKLSPSATSTWFNIVSVKQSLWTLREAGTKEGRWVTSGPLIL